MANKRVKKTKSSRVNVTSRKTTRKARGFNFALIFVPLLVVVALGSFFVLMQVNNKAYAASSISPKGCVNGSTYSNKNVTTFVKAYQKGSQAKLTSYLECGGAPVWEDTFYEFDLSANSHKLQVAEYKYKDGQPRGNASKLTCSLKVVSSTNATLNCSNGKYAFNLYK